MATLIRPKLWGRQKPPPGAAIDWGHPLAQSLVEGWSFPSGQSLRKGVPQILIPNGSVTPSPQLGGSFNFSNPSGFNGSTAPHLQLSPVPLVGFRPQFTVIAEIQVPASAFVGSNSVGDTLYCERSAVGVGGNDIWAAATTNCAGTTTAQQGPGLTYRDDSANLLQGSSSSYTVYDGTPHQLAWTRNSVTSFTTWVDGNLVITSTSGSLTSNFTDTTTFACLATIQSVDNTYGSRTWFPGSVSYLYLYSRPLTVEDMHWLKAEPYAFFAPQAPRRRYFVSSGAAIDLPAATVAMAFGTSGVPYDTGKYPAHIVGLNFGTVSQPFEGRNQTPSAVQHLGFGVAGGPSMQHKPPAQVSLGFGVSGNPTPAAVRADAGFEVWIYDILSPNGLPIAVVPNPVSVTFEDVLSDVGSWSVEVNTVDMPASVWAKDNVWKILWNGLELFAGIGEQIQDTAVQTSEIRQRITAGKGIAQWLDKMKVYPGNWGGPGSPTASQNFANASLATIYLYLLQQGFNRGTATWMSTYIWNGRHDTAAQQWTDVYNLSVDAGTSMLDLIQQYQALLPWDWHVDSRGRISLWKSAGVDHTSTIKFGPVGSMVSSQVTTDNTSLWSTVLVEDSNQGFSEQSDSPTVTTFGRRETFASSSSVVDSTGRADYGYSLLQSFIVQDVQKVVQVDTTTPGRRPFIDYGLGDKVSVEFTDGTVAAARVIGIAMNGGQDVIERAEVTFDFMMAQSSPQNVSTSAITSGSGGNQTIYVDNGSTAYAATPTPTIALQMVVEAFTTTYAEFNALIYGQASTALTMTATILLNTGGGFAPIRTLTEQMDAGAQTWNPAFMIPSLASGTATLAMQLSVSTGTFTVAGSPDTGDMEMWITGPNLNGGVGGASPEIDIVDTIPFGGATMPQVVTDALTLRTSTPVGMSRADPVSVGGPTGYPVVTDVYDGNAFMLQPGFAITVATGPDDSDDNGTTWTSTGTQLEAGNDGGTIFGWAARFVIPTPYVPSSAYTVTRAFITGTVDQNDNNASLVIYAEKSATPATITSHADFGSRTLTTASVPWTPGSVVSGSTIQSVDISPIIQELVTAYGNTIRGIQIFVKDNGGPVNGKMELRSFENTNSGPPILTFRWHE